MAKYDKSLKKYKVQEDITISSAVKRTFVGLLALSGLSGCANALCGAQTDHATNPLQRENTRLECERQVMNAIDEKERQEQKENDALFKAHMEKHTKTSK
ncbi:hypothetical protein [Shewanella marisflavi]|uniref:Lipoprotein n=1 Tax=Shewanella marisflavi TaxID=260364 RepID=A0AAC9U3F5_9GAMM|nr:hypothetical protein [Shewanella marisflavi]ASJ98463.1 hypothetical protein CFF01_18745 [Shewanella marisflavi]